MRIVSCFFWLFCYGLSCWARDPSGLESQRIASAVVQQQQQHFCQLAAAAQFVAEVQAQAQAMLAYYQRFSAHIELVCAQPDVTRQQFAELVDIVISVPVSHFQPQCWEGWLQSILWKGVELARRPRGDLDESQARYDDIIRLINYVWFLPCLNPDHKKEMATCMVQAMLGLSDVLGIRAGQLNRQTYGAEMCRLGREIFALRKKAFDGAMMWRLPELAGLCFGKLSQCYSLNREVGGVPDSADSDLTMCVHLLTPECLGGTERFRRYLRPGDQRFIDRLTAGQQSKNLPHK